MGILLSFAPFIVFALVDTVTGPANGLMAGAAVSVILIIRNWLNGRRAPKILEIGSLLLFGGLAIYAAIFNPDWSLIGVRLWVDTGLLLIVLASIAIRQPFTLQYARERVAHEYWQRPDFIRSNYIITAAWALAFVVSVCADLVLLYVPDLPPRVGIIATIVALVAAVKFTAWYPAHLRAKAAA